MLAYATSFREQRILWYISHNDKNLTFVFLLPNNVLHKIMELIRFSANAHACQCSITDTNFTFNKRSMPLLIYTPNIYT